MRSSLICLRTSILTSTPPQDQQLHVQLGPHEVLRGRHRAVPTIRTRAARVDRAQEPTPPPAARAAGPRHRAARAVRARARDRVPARHVPGRRARRAAHARAERRRHIRPASRARDLERVGRRHREGRDGPGDGSREDVPVRVCARRARGGDAPAQHSAARAHVRRASKI